MGAITTAMVKMFASNVQHLAQAKGSRLRNAVRVETGVVGEEAYFDQIGSTAAIKRTTRNADTPLIEADFQRRRVSIYDYEWATLVDKQDKRKLKITDPSSDLAMSAAWALGRAIDDSILDNATGTAYTGKAGGTSTTLPSAQKIGSSSTALTLAKLREAKKILDANDVDPDEPRYIAVNAENVYTMLGISQMTSADYNSVKALVAGEINTFLGFEFIMTNRLNTGTNSDEKAAVCWAKNGLLLAVQQDITANIEDRADKSYSTQVYLSMGIGSTRMEEDKVVQIDCDQSGI
jgi:hypothetical protein